MSAGVEAVSARERVCSCLYGDGAGAMASESSFVRGGNRLLCCVLVGVSGRGSLCSGDEGVSGNGNRMGSESGKCCLCVLRASVGVSEKV